MIPMVVGNENGDWFESLGLDSCDYGLGITGINNGYLRFVRVSDQPDIIVVKGGCGLCY